MSAASNPHIPRYLRSMDTTGSESGPHPLPRTPAIRIGHGYDLHRLETIIADGPARPFVLGGIRIPHEKGPVGHSDGDALLHAITDAILASVAQPDIGQLFPDSDPIHDGQDSRIFLIESIKRLTDAGFRIMNLDATIVCERPKIGSHKDEIRRNIAEILSIRLDQINIKGKTHERVDAIGEGRAIEVHCVALVELINP